MMGFVEYSKFEKTTDVHARTLSFGGSPIFTPPMDNLRLGQHHNPRVDPRNGRYQDIEVTREWLETIKYGEADSWIEYIKELHASIRDNGVYLNYPIKTVAEKDLLVVKDGEHRVGACVANSTRVPCVIINKPKEDFRKFVDYKTRMAVSVQYDEWRGDENRHKVMEQLDWKGKNVLDVGCNTGSACNAARELRAGRVYGIDYDPECIFKAAKPNMCFICHDLGKGFAIKDDIDILIMNSIIHWVGTPKFYDSVRKVVESGAIVLFESHHENLEPALYNIIKGICPNYELIGYSPFRKGASRKRGIYLMSGIA